MQLVARLGWGITLRFDGGRIYRDAPYPAYDLVVELDGRLDHSALADRDLT